MNKLSRTAISTVVAAMIALIPASPALAQAVAHEHQQADKSGKQMQEMKMSPPHMEEMAAKKKANTARITSLMAQAQTATGDAKVAALVDVIAVLVEERAAMQEHCASMMSAMPMMKK